MPGLRGASALDCEELMHSAPFGHARLREREASKCVRPMDALVYVRNRLQ